jgi:tetratricopeptide (TPR) repeat protein
LNNSDGALSAYQRALQIVPASAEARLKLSKVYVSNNRLEEAQAEMKRAVIDSPNNAEIYLRLAEAHLAGGQWQEAASAAEHAIQLGATDSHALYLLGTALLRMDKREEGQERLQEFARVEAGFQQIERRDREIVAASLAAVSAVRDGRGSAAIEELTEGIAMYPDAQRLRMLLGMVQSRLGQHQMAAETFESMLKLGMGRRFLIHKILADEYATLGDMEASRRHREIYLETRDAELIVYKPE